MTEQAQTITELAAPFVADSAAAVRLTRAILRLLGGQKVYLPRPDAPLSRVTGDLAEVCARHLGNAGGDAFLRRFLHLFGGGSVYFVLERVAFRDETALEIYAAYNGTNERLSDLCRQYQMSFRQIYAMCARGREITRKARN